MTEPQRPSLNHLCFVMEPHDYQFVIDALTPLTRNPHCGDLAKELIVALSRAQESKIFHIFAESDTKSNTPARFLHNDPDFKMEEL
jgi:hypothetical protein